MLAASPFVLGVPSSSRQSVAEISVPIINAAGERLASHNANLRQLLLAGPHSKPSTQRPTACTRPSQPISCSRPSQSAACTNPLTCTRSPQPISCTRPWWWNEKDISAARMGQKRTCDYFLIPCVNASSQEAKVLYPFYCGNPRLWTLSIGSIAPTEQFFKSFTSH